jgi:hypothetical protein
LAVVVAGLVGLVGGCAETTAPADSDSAPPETDTTALDVVPEFSVEGTQQIPEALRLTQLGFSVAQIELIPANGGQTVVVDDPFRVEFDMASGELTRRQAAFTVPEPGTYAVEVRLEPIDEDTPYTFRLDGEISPEIAEALESGNPHQDGGNPIPDPFHPDDDETSESGGEANWVTFEYLSEKAVTYRLDSVELGSERRILSFELNINDWADELIEPIAELARAHTNEDTSEQTDVAQTVDVTRTLDSTGRGYEFLADDVRVQAVQMHSETATP